MKKALFTLLFAMTALVIAWAQPKVAVLDAIIPQNMDPSVISPATDKIIEKLVQSNRFTVLDRANIENVLKEREFQVSGMVSDQDAVTAGKYLGADFIVVSKISKVGDTNFISGKMINVKSGVIVSTTSAQGEGKLAVVISLAGQVGEVLAGGVATQPPAQGQDVVVAPPPVEVVPESPPPAETQVVTPPRASRSGGGAASNFIGVGFFINSNSWKEKDEAGGYSYTETDKYSLSSLQFSVVASKYLQLGIGMTWFNSGTYEWENTSTGYSGSGDLMPDYTASWMDISMLFRIPIRMGSTMALVPLFGFEYDINMSLKDSSGNDIKSLLTDEARASLNKFYLQVGAGIQIDVGNIVIYPEFIYGFKVKSQLDKDTETDAVVNRGWSTSKVSEGKLDFGLIVGFKI
jgi:hypothetical protein